MNLTAYRPLRALQAQCLWIWSWLATPAGTRRWLRVCRGARRRSSPQTPNAPKRPAPPRPLPPFRNKSPALSRLLVVLPDRPSRQSAARNLKFEIASFSDACRWGGSLRAAGDADEVAAQWEGERSAAGRRNCRSSPGGDPAPEANGRGRDSQDSDTAQWNQADIASRLFLLRKDRPARNRRRILTPKFRTVEREAPKSERIVRPLP